MNTNMDHNIGNNMGDDLEIIHMNTYMDDNIGDKMNNNVKLPPKRGLICGQIRSIRHCGV